jgi:nitrogen fixation protein FixH
MNTARTTRTEPAGGDRLRIRRQLACAALLTILAMLPGCSKKPSVQTEGQAQNAALPATADTAGPWRMELKVTPDHPSMTKPIMLVLHLADDSGQPVSDADVNGSLTMKLMDMGATPVKFAAKGNGDYEATLNGVDMSGPWNLAIDAARGSTHAKKDFEVTISD